MGIVEIIAALAKIFIMLIPGFLFRKRNIISDDQTNGVSIILTCVTYPCLIIDAMQMSATAQVLNNCKYIALITLGIIIIALILSKVIGRFAKFPKARLGLLTFMLVFGNTGFIGLPVLSGLLGEKAVFYVVICDATYNIFLFTLGLALLKSAANSSQGLAFSKKDSLKGLLDPCMIAVIIGLVFFLCNFTLPDVIGAPIEMLGSATIPLAMFIVGTQLASINIRELLKSKQVYLTCFLKLIVVPAVALLLVKLLIGTSSVLATVIVIEAAMPTAMSAVIFTRQYKGDVDFATKGVLLSTLLCIITVPIFAIILRSI